MAHPKLTLSRIRASLLSKASELAHFMAPLVQDFEAGGVGFMGEQRGMPRVIGSRQWP